MARLGDDGVLRARSPTHLGAADLRELGPSASAQLLWAIAKTCRPSFTSGERDASSAAAATAAAATNKDETGTLSETERLFDAVCADVELKLVSFSQSEMVGTAWALATLAREGDGFAFKPPATLVSSLAIEATRWLPSFEPEACRTLAWAYAGVARADAAADYAYAGGAAAFVAALGDEARRRLSEQESAPLSRDEAYLLGACEQYCRECEETLLVGAGGIAGGRNKRPGQWSKASPVRWIVDRVTSMLL